MKMRDWYYLRNGEKAGPITTQQLVTLARARKVVAEDLVWCEGLSEWTPASKIKGLLPAEPPPIPASPQQSNGRDNANEAQPRAVNGVPPVSVAKAFTGSSKPTESFIEWHRRRLKIVHSLPSVICWAVNFLLWSYGCGFIWIPIWYVIDSAEGGDIGTKIKSLVNKIPVGQCPSCKENWAREIIDKKLVGKRQGYRTVTRYDEHRVGSFGGEKVGETRRDEQIVVTICTFLITCHCKKCGHTWSETAEEER